MQVDMWDQDEVYAIARYTEFRVERVPAAPSGIARDEFILYLGGYREIPGHRMAGDSMGQYNGSLFSQNNRSFVGDLCANRARLAPGWYVLIIFVQSNARNVN